MTATLERQLSSLSRAEKVALIAQVRAERPDLTGREKAALIGMSYRAYANLITDPDGSKQQARRDGYKGVCGRCGGETKSDGTSRPARHCAGCAIELQHEAKVWTRERVIEAIQEWASEHGRPPLATDWLHSDPDGRWPNRGSVYRSGNHSSSPFASWADAIEAAGFPRPLIGKFERTEQTRQRMSEARIVWTHAVVIAAIRAHVAATGEVPLTRAGAHNPALPCAHTVYHHGWSWPDLVREAGFTPRHNGRGYWTPERIIDAIRAWNDEYGYPPKSTQWSAAHDATYPSLTTVLKHFGRWNNAMEVAGFEPRHRHVYEAKAAA